MTMTRFVTRLGCRPLATIAHGGPRGQGRQAHLGGMSTTHCQALGLMESGLVGFQACHDRVGRGV